MRQNKRVREKRDKKQRKGIEIRGREDMREEKKEGKERTKSTKVW